jgi:hypothetical protein
MKYSQISYNIMKGTEFFVSLEMSVITEYNVMVNSEELTFKNCASYIYDGRTATLQMLHFIYFFNKYKYWVF